MEELMDNLIVAKVILEQLGGRRFMAMTGAKNFTGSEYALNFRLPGSGGFTKNGINHVRIELTPGDDYTVTFNRIRGTKVTEISKHEHAYAQDLQELFSRETGLDTHL
jgi:hypothetical protein